MWHNLPRKPIWPQIYFLHKNAKLIMHEGLRKRNTVTQHEIQGSDDAVPIAVPHRLCFGAKHFGPVTF
jgi:hypothetical protein